MDAGEADPAKEDESAESDACGEESTSGPSGLMVLTSPPG